MCKKWELFFVKSEVESQWWDILLSQQIEHVVDGIINCLSVTQLIH